MKFKKLIPHEIKITPLANESLLVKIGCATLAYGKNDMKQMLKDLQEYLEIPKEVEQEYRKVYSSESDLNYGRGLAEQQYEAQIRQQSTLAASGGIAAAR